MMSNIPKVIDQVVKYNLCIGCGLCIYKCPSNALKMRWNEEGFLTPELTGNCDSKSECISVCPFNPFPGKEVETENELVNLFLNETTKYHEKIGKFDGIYAGYSNEYRLSSSSGGIATYVLTQLLERGIVDHVFSVKESLTTGVYYEYAISNNRDELLNASKTRYFPVTLGTVFPKINELEGKVAVVGVACFIKAIRLAQFAEPALRTKIPFLVGIICGGVKSRFFTEYLSSKIGVTSDNISKPLYRIKDINSTASDYAFGCYDSKTNQAKSIKMIKAGDMWGTGLFKANACDFCDDVTTELADISIGDAWIIPYKKDGKGTNTIITRSELAMRIIQEGINKTELYIEELKTERLVAALQGSYNHRHLGLPFRIRMVTKNGIIISPKRFGIDNSISIYFKFVQFWRMKVRKRSLTIWRNSANAAVFDKKMEHILKILNKLTLLYHFQRENNNISILKKIYRKIFR